MKNLILITSALGLFTLAAAQQGGNFSGQPGQITPEMRARFEKMRPVFDLAQDIRLLPELEKNKATAMTKAQAAQLLPILKKLQTAQSIDPNDAKKYLAQIEDKIMTDPQVTAMDDLQLKAQQERAARRAQAQKNGQSVRVPGMPPTGIFGGNRQGQAGQNGAGQNSAQAGSFNPFARGRSADALKTYIAVLQKK